MNKKREENKMKRKNDGIQNKRINKKRKKSEKLNKKRRK